MGQGHHFRGQLLFGVNVERGSAVLRPDQLDVDNVGTRDEVDGLALDWEEIGMDDLEEISAGSVQVATEGAPVV